MIKELITSVMLHLSNIYTRIYGDVYSGHYDIESEYFEPNFYEKYLYLFPSFVNHFYAGLFYPNYMYQKNNLYYLSLFGETKKIIAPLMFCTNEGNNYKNLIGRFCTNIPLIYIFNFNNFVPDELSFKYVKSGLQTKEMKKDEFLYKTLENIVNE